jgi:hypothetical protein
MNKKMIEEYKGLTEYFCFDAKYLINEFFSDLKTFCFQFQVKFVFKILKISVGEK